MTRKQRTKARIGPGLQPTDERLRQANGLFDTGRRDGPVRDRGSETVRMLDEPLEWLLAKRVISRRQYEAGRKFYAHWYLAGMSPQITPRYEEFVARFEPPGDRLFACERRAYYLGEYREALAEMGKICGRIVQGFICENRSAEDLAAGYLRRYGSRGRSSVLDIVKVGLETLVETYGM